MPIRAGRHRLTDQIAARSPTSTPTKTLVASQLPHRPGCCHHYIPLKKGTTPPRPHPLERTPHWICSRPTSADQLELTLCWSRSISPRQAGVPCHGSSFGAGASGSAPLLAAAPNLGMLLFPSPSTLKVFLLDIIGRLVLQFLMDVCEVIQ